MLLFQTPPLYTTAACDLTGGGVNPCGFICLQLKVLKSKACKSYQVSKANNKMRHTFMDSDPSHPPYLNATTDEPRNNSLHIHVHSRIITNSRIS